MVEDDITVSQHWGRMRHEWEKQYIESDISTQMTMQVQMRVTEVTAKSCQTNKQPQRAFWNLYRN